jgi:hypothetical protein
VICGSAGTPRLDDYCGRGVEQQGSFVPRRVACQVARCKSGTQRAVHSSSFRPWSLTRPPLQRRLSTSQRQSTMPSRQNNYTAVSFAAFIKLALAVNVLPM